MLSMASAAFCTKLFLSGWRLVLTEVCGSHVDAYPPVMGRDVIITRRHVAEPDLRKCSPHVGFRRPGFEWCLCHALVVYDLGQFVPQHADQEHQNYSVFPK